VGARVQWLLRFATPAPDETIDPNIVTPGVIGFILTIALAIAVVLLIVDMTRRIRRINYRAQANEKLDAEEAASEE
jgi:capsular polysaccharide biosynthesis protein